MATVYLGRGNVTTTTIVVIDPMRSFVMWKGVNQTNFNAKAPAIVFWICGSVTLKRNATMAVMRILKCAPHSIQSATLRECFSVPIIGVLTRITSVTILTIVVMEVTRSIVRTFTRPPLIPLALSTNFNAETEIVSHNHADVMSTTIACKLFFSFLRYSDYSPFFPSDRSDEKDCDHHLYMCMSSEFLCPEFLCIDKVWLCDGENDCIDGSDEMNCTSTNNTAISVLTSDWPKPFSNGSCPMDWFTCKMGRCIPMNWHCDGNIDCPDRSDETDCGGKCFDVLDYDLKFESF